MKAEYIIIEMKKIFSRFGIPEEIKSGRCPQYASKEFQQFAMTWGFKHITSSPRYPRSNGLAERMVQSVKNLFTKALSSQQDPYLAILENRNTPVDGFASPAQLLMSRSLRSTIPTLPQCFKSKVIDAQDFQKNRKRIQRQQKLYYDKQAHSLPTLEKGENVRIRDKKMWKPATVLRSSSEPHSYVVQTPEGRRYRRNRSHLLKLKQQNRWQIKDEEVDEEEMTIQISGETDDLRQNKEIVGHFENIDKHYITRSGRVSKPPQRLKYYLVIIDIDTELVFIEGKNIFTKL
jgi:transposase InsO family protein